MQLQKRHRGGLMEAEKIAGRRNEVRAGAAQLV